MPGGNDEGVPDTTWNALLKWYECERERERGNRSRENRMEKNAFEERLTTTETPRGRTQVAVATGETRRRGCGG